MTTDLSHFRFVAKALPNQGARPRELARTMPAHPLSYMELPYDPEYTLYNLRLTPEKLDTATDDEMYWAVRTNVIFRHTGELPIEISGPDAETLLNKVFTRSVSKVKPGRCSYQFACYHDGGMITDGVLLRLSQGARMRRPLSKSDRTDRQGDVGPTPSCCPTPSDLRWRCLPGLRPASGWSSGRPTAQNGS